MAVPVLTDGRTVLRGLVAADAPAYAALNRDPLNVAWAGSDAAMSEVAAAALISGEVAEGWASGGSLRFGIAAAAPSTAGAWAPLLGTTSLQGVFQPATGGGSASVGIKLAAHGRGQGHARAAVALLCRYAFDTLGLEVLHWRATVGNVPSQQLATASGFELSATIPGFGHAYGRVADGWMFTQTVQQWRARSTTPGTAPHTTAPGTLPAVVPTVPRLGDGTLLLRALHDGDAAQLVSNCRDEAAIRWTTVPLHYSHEHATTFIQQITVEGWRSGRVLTFAVADAASDALLGTLDLQCPAPGVASVGINMGPHTRGSGAAERAVRLLAEYAFSQLNLSFLHWHALVPNWGSRKLAWKLGFRFEAEIRGGYDDRGTPADRWVLTLAAGDPRHPQASWDGPPPPTR